MKKNLYLSGILLALLLGTYVFQELRTKQVFEESFTKDHLVLAEEIQSLSWGEVQAIKKDGQWWADDKLLSANTFKQLEKRIGQIKKIKEVVGHKQSFLSSPVELKVNAETRGSYPRSPGVLSLSQ